jgi:hypothetical protein
MRLHPSKSNATVVLPDNIQIFTNTSNATYRWAICLNPILSGSDNASWNNILSSSVQYDTSRNSTNAIISSVILDSGYGSGKSELSVSSDRLISMILGTTVDGVSDQIVLGIQSLGSTADYYASVSWREI